MANELPASHPEESEISTATDNEEEYFRFYDMEDYSTSAIAVKKNITRFMVFGLEDIMFSGIDQLIHLTELWIVECNLKKLPNIAHCQKLEKLYVHSNALEALPDLGNLPNLSVLWFSDNKIFDLKCILRCFTLKELFFPNNLVRTFNHFLSSLTALEQINASGNPIMDIQVVVELKPLKSLKSLTFADPMYHLSPIVKQQNYRSFIVFSLPQLKQLDFVKIATAESENAKEYFNCTMKLFSLKYHGLLSECYFKMSMKLVRSQAVLESLKNRFYKCALKEKQAIKSGENEIVEKQKWEQRHLETELLKWETNHENYDANDEKKFEINVKFVDLEMKYIGNIYFERHGKDSDLLALCQNMINSFTCSYAKIASVENVIVDRVIHVINKLNGFDEELEMMVNLTEGQNPGLHLMYRPVPVSDVNDWPLEYIKHYVSNSSGTTQRSLVTNCLAVADHSWLNCHDIHKKIFLTKDKKCGRRVTVIGLTPTESLSKCGWDEVKKHHVNERGLMTECQECKVYSAEVVIPVFVVEFHYNYHDLMKQLEVILNTDVDAPSSPGSEILCRLSDPAPWQNMKELNLTKAGLSKIEIREPLPNIKLCDFSYNKFKSLDEFAFVFPNVECINISFNSINSLLSLEKMKLLQRLNVSWNDLTELISNLKHVETCAPQLLFLDMSHHCFKDVHFSRHILFFVKTFLPQLKKFNNDWMRTVDVNVTKTFDGLYDFPLIEREEDVLEENGFHLRWKSILECTKGSKVRGSHATLVGPKRDLICLAIVGGKQFNRFRVTQRLDHIRWLTISVNSLSSALFLTPLTSLQEINLSRNALSSLDTSFNSLNSLIRLDLSCNYLTSLREFATASLPSLKILNVSMNFLESLEGVESMKHLEELYACLNKLSSLHCIRHIKYLKNLIIFDVRKNAVEENLDLKNFIFDKIPTIEFINGVAAVRDTEDEEENSGEIIINNEYLQKELNISKPSLITKLSLGNLGLNQLLLDGNVLVNLKSFNLEGNFFTSLHSLSKLKKLRKLCLSHNHVHRFSEEGMTSYDESVVFDKLEELHLDNNGLLSVEALELERMPNLKTLFLQDNVLANLSGIQKLSNLQHLVVDRNNIHIIFPRDVHGLHKLTILHAESNHIHDLEFLLFLLKLKKIFLGYNNITDVGSIHYLGSLRNLKELSLVGNPVISSKTVYEDLFKTMKNLKIINGFSIQW